MKVENSSGLSPLGRAVLVRYYEPERKQSLLVIPESVQDKVQSVEQRAQVIAVGPECWVGENSPRARVGDYVLISKFCGYACKGPKDGQPYRLINDRDVFAAITHIEE